MTSLSETIRYVETSQVASQLSVANGLEDLDYLLPRISEIGAVLRASDRRDVVRVIVTRLQELSEESINFEFRNPADFAIAAYLWILGRISPEVAKMVAPRIRRIPNTWWGALAAAGTESGEWAVFRAIAGNADDGHQINIFDNFAARILVPTEEPSFTARDSADTQSTEFMLSDPRMTATTVSVVVNEAEYA